MTIRFIGDLGLKLCIPFCFLLPVTSCGGSESSNAGDNNSEASCTPTDASCNEVESECLAFADNTNSSVLGFRMSQLTITGPETLSTSFMNKLVTAGITLDKPECYLNGDGTFSWLLQFDTTTGKLCTGGGNPVTDPTEPYTYIRENMSGFDVAPIELDVPINGTSFDAGSGTAELLYVPIFLDTTYSSWIILPLHNVRLYEGLLTSNNCIGTFNADTLDPANSCLPDDDTTDFTNGAKLEGYITLEEADTVVVDQLSETLCVLLFGTDKETYGDGDPDGDGVTQCKRDGDGNIAMTGDWCSATNSEATSDCADSVHLAAEFAASAVTIDDSCN